MKLHIFLLLFALCLCGCDPGSSNPVFTAPGQQGRTVTQQLRSDRAGSYRLAEPVVVKRTDASFKLRLRGGVPGMLLSVVGSADRRLTAKQLPNSGEVELYLPLQRDAVIHGFRIDPPPAAGGDSFQILEAAITDSFSGLKQEGRKLALGTAVQRVREARGSVELEISAPRYWPLRRPDGGSVDLAGDDGVAKAETANPAWQISLGFHSRPFLSYADFHLGESLARLAEQSGEAGSKPPLSPQPGPRRALIRLRLLSGSQAVSFVHTALQGRQSLYLYHGMVPFVPDRLEIEALGGGAVRLQSFEIARLPESAQAEGAPSDPPPPPLPADPGGVLLYDPAAWRSPLYELFAWSRFADILIMDTASYSMQSRFFKRLAFFVEKDGYRGDLVSNEEFAALHGFNAHDYRAEDLARFFQAAREQLFDLNPEEELLKRILLDNGIIRDEGVITPGRGGILSISRSSSPLLRRHLLSHECCHGLFFSLPEFREASFAAWERLSETEKRFWRLFFRWVGYDTSDPYLTVNEYQAYLFQQPRYGVRYYFAVLTASRLIAAYPDQASWLREFLGEDPESFTRSFDELEPSLLRIAGLEGGRVIELE